MVSLRAVVDSSGNLIKRTDYNSFGNIIRNTAPSFEIPFRFAGGLYDKHTGLIRFGHRDYDPATSHWTAKDTILFQGGSTYLYGYCMNDPVNFVDSDGKFPILGTIASFCPESFLSGQKLAPLLLFKKEETRKSKDYITTFLFLFVTKKR